MNQVNPQILRDQDQTHIYFAPQKLWDFVHVEHFELSHDQVVNENISLFFEDIKFFKNALNRSKSKQSSYREHEYFIKTKQKNRSSFSS